MPPQAGSSFTCPALGPAEVSRLCYSWPQLDELRRAARSGVVSRWNNAKSSVVATVRVEFTAAIQAARARLRGVSAREDIGLAVLVIQGLARYNDVLGLLSGGLSHLATLTRWTPAQSAEAAAALRCSVGVSVLPLTQASPCVGPPSPLGPTCKFPHATLAFGSALACGWSWSLAMTLFSQLSDGWFSSDGRFFWTVQGVQSHLWSDGRDWLGSSIRSEAHDHTVLFFHRKGVLGVVVASMSLRVQMLGSQSSGLVMRTRKDGSRFPSRFLPAWLRLPRNDSGRLIVPAFRVTSVIERRFEWRAILGNIDGTAWAILCG